MRLIDADELIKEIEETALEVEHNMQGRRNGKTLAKGCLSGLACVRERILRTQPAYDIDKVVEELKKLSYDYANLRSDDGYIAINEAIEIVKVGGENGNNL